MPSDAAARLDAIAAELRAHLPCPSKPCATCTQLVAGEGDPQAAVVIVGEAPGAKEDAAGRPFVGPSGRLLDLLLAEAGLSRGSVFITNVVKARPPGNRDPTREEVAHHWPWLAAQLDAIAPRLVVPLGRHALGRFAGTGKGAPTIGEVHGRVLEVPADPDALPFARPARTLFPLYHPAAALHSPPLRVTLFDDARALGLAVRDPQRR